MVIAYTIHHSIEKRKRIWWVLNFIICTVYINLSTNVIYPAYAIVGI
ncbi:hypothetical protein SAMN04488023_106123 [Pedobacter rhizosphaerae]|uniref:Uncharacterized protein n=1 Tax=Pedobacter rhizosphaerae TaxID=390241 RepID=A0A1H9MT23_9SPHI|nr:hypothetical protein SAMN04488023_106123 [Pedobacter rhizosphaerae]